MKRFILILAIAQCFFSIDCQAISPRTIPKELLAEFTLNGQIPVLDGFRDDTPRNTKLFSKKIIDQYIELVREGKYGYYRVTDKWLYKALNKYPIKNKSVLIIGSAKPWYEAIVLAYGGHPITLEYNSLYTDDDRLEILNYKDYIGSDRKFDMMLSISSIEHDGLGRYGDPINPTADLETMDQLAERLKKDGVMFFAAPVGSDALIWNACRIYGPLRLPMLFRRWLNVDSFGYKPEVLGTATLGKYTYQPVFVLKAKKH